MNIKKLELNLTTIIRVLTIPLIYLIAADLFEFHTFVINGIFTNQGYLIVYKIWASLITVLSVVVVVLHYLDLYKPSNKVTILWLIIDIILIVLFICTLILVISMLSYDLKHYNTFLYVVSTVIIFMQFILYRK